MHSSALVTRSLLVALVFASGACAVATPDKSSESEGENAPTAAPVLDGTVSQIICDAVHHLPSFSAGVNVNADCALSTYDDLFFYGAQPLTTLVTPSGRPANMTDALYCALKDADHARADATVDPGFGRFGLASDIDVYKKDPAARAISAQRNGVLYLFGVGLPIESQDVLASFPTESVYRQLGWARMPWARGHYLKLGTSRADFHVGIDGTLPTVPPIKLAVSLQRNGNYQSLRNNQFAFGGDGQYRKLDQPDPNGPYSWNAFVSQCNACRARSIWCFNCPSSADQAGHDAFATWGDAQYANLGDGVLPYMSADGGVSGNYIYRNNANDWFQFGFPDGGEMGTPTHMNDAGTTFNFDVGTSIEIVHLDVNTRLDLRGGFELAHQDEFIDGNKWRVDVATQLSAQTSVDVSAHVQIDNPFPFGPDPLIEADFTLVKPDPRRQTTAPTFVEFDPNATQIGFSAYSKSGVAQDPNAALASCFAQPETRAPEPSGGDLGAAIQQADVAASKALHVCQVQLCDDQSLLENCELDAARTKLVCTKTTQTCNQCFSGTVSLCDDAGHVYPPTKLSHTAQACQPR